MAERPLLDPRIVVRFGDVLLSHGYTAVPNLVLKYYRDAGISDGEMMFTIHVWQYWWSAQNPFPSLGSIAARMQKDIRQVRRYEASLIEKGLLRVVDRQDAERGQLTNEFDFTPLIRRIIDLARLAGDVEETRRDDGISRTVRGADRNVLPPPDKTVRPPSDKNVRGAAGRSVRPPRTVLPAEEDTVDQDTYRRNGNGREDPNSIWFAVLKEVRAGITQSAFRRWFSGTLAMDLAGHRLVVSVPSTEQCTVLGDRLYPQIDNALRMIGHPDVRVQFEVRSEEASS